MSDTVSDSIARELDRAAARLDGAGRILVITGAGVSADSGLPTYRGVGGLYCGKATEEGVSVEDALSGEMLRWKPEVCWKYILELERNCRGAAYNRAHQVIAEMERYFEEVLVFTQNVDSLHLHAGSRNVAEVHGSLRELYCMICGRRERPRDFSGLKIPPVCPDCGGNQRPDVVLFGELLPRRPLAMVEEFLSRSVDLCFSVGTSSLFPYIMYPVVQVKAAGGWTVEINPGGTTVSGSVDCRIKLGAARALDGIWNRFLGVTEGEQGD